MWTRIHIPDYNNQTICAFAQSIISLQSLLQGIIIFVFMFHFAYPQLKGFLLGQPHLEFGGIKAVCEHSTLPLTCQCATKQQ